MAEQDELTTVMTFSTRAEADLAQERLQSEGVDAFVMDETTSGVMPYLMAASGIRLQVPTEQVEKAREILGLADAPPEGKPFR
jgi:Putative prokaryotic signal transducing protein